MDIEQPANNIHPLWVPNADAMRQHVDHLFGGYLDGMQDGLIELAWTDPRPDASGRYSLSHAILFGTDDTEALVAEACRINAIPQCNVYIGAALRKPGISLSDRTSDVDFLALTTGYCDLDDDGSPAVAKTRYGQAKPTMVVVTGKEPYTRAQMWWRLDEPITDPAVSEALLSGMATVLGGDHTVTNPSRVMRLAGSIAWPLKPGRQLEQTYIAPLKEPGQPSYALGHLSRLFPPAQGFTPTSSGPRVRTTDPVSAYDAFGHHVDGRETLMRDLIWAAVLDWRRECPIKPGAVESRLKAMEKYEVYEQLVSPRLLDPELTKTELLQREGRGPDAFLAKWYAAMRRWDGKVREAAKQPGKSTDENRPQQFPSPDHGKTLILTSKQFADTLKPPSYIIDGIIQQGFLYSLTARTHHGKTAVIMRACADLIRGEPFAGCKTRQGSVLFFAGENPQDVRARYVAMCDVLKIDTNTAPFYFVDGRVDIEYNLARIRAEAEVIPDLRLIVVDTAAAYFPGDDGNSNAQLARYAGLLRQLTFLPSLPTGIVNCHPVKNAAQDNLLPMGGSAFVNEVDGNLTLWADGGDKTTTLHWQGKFRGPEFDQVSFELKEITSEKVRDGEGRLMPSVMAVYLPENVAERRGAVNEEEENVILRLIHADKHASLAALAQRAGFTKSKVQRITRNLKEDRMLRKFRGTKYRVTRKGCTAAGIVFEGENDEE